MNITYSELETILLQVELKYLSKESKDKWDSLMDCATREKLEEIKIINDRVQYG